MANNPLTGPEKRLFNSLKHNLLAKNKMGSSKHEAKQHARESYLAEYGNLIGWNPAKVEGIYSYNTMISYIAVMKPFARYCASQGAQRQSDIHEEMAENYLKMLEASGKSAWTISSAASAINKSLGYTLSPSKLGLRSRRKEDITRSRLPRAHDTRNFTKYSNQITFSKGTGVRRMSMLTVRPCDCIRNADNTIIGVRVREKGGRLRTAPVLTSHLHSITEIVDNAIASRGATAPIFDDYNIHIDNHRFRAEYAADLLYQLEYERNSGLPLFAGSFRLEDYCHLKGKDTLRRSQTQNHDTDLLGAISGALGHARIDVILRHYLYLQHKNQTPQKSCAVCEQISGWTFTSSEVA